MSVDFDLANLLLRGVAGVSPACVERLALALAEIAHPHASFDIGTKFIDATQAGTSGAISFVEQPIDANCRVVSTPGSDK